MSKKYDLIAIGDVVTDAFIRLKSASVECDLDKKNCRLCLSFADKIPYESLEVIPAVGNSSNVAVGVARLGFKTAMLTGLGDDFYGKEILKTYKKEGVDTRLVRVNKGRETNYHFVLNYEAERTILIKHNDFEYYDIRKIDDVPWIYFSSIAESAVAIHDRLAEHLEKHPKVKMGFNPGTFQMKLGIHRLQAIYRHTHVLFVNREEAQRILGINNADVKFLFPKLHGLGPKIVVITDGPDGAYVSDGNKAFFMKSYPDPAPPFERTGAGDAFSTGFISGLMAGLPIEEAIRWAPIQSMSVVQYTGAQKGLLQKEKLQEYLKNAPADYVARPL